MNLTARFIEDRQTATGAAEPAKGAGVRGSRRQQVPGLFAVHNALRGQPGAVWRDHEIVDMPGSGHERAPLKPTSGRDASTLSRRLRQQAGLGIAVKHRDRPRRATGRLGAEGIRDAGEIQRLAAGVGPVGTVAGQLQSVGVELPLEVKLPSRIRSTR